MPLDEQTQSAQTIFAQKLLTLGRPGRKHGIQQTETVRADTVRVDTVLLQVNHGAKMPFDEQTQSAQTMSAQNLLTLGRPERKHVIQQTDSIRADTVRADTVRADADLLPSQQGREDVVRRTDTVRADADLSPSQPGREEFVRRTDTFRTDTARAEAVVLLPWSTW